MKRQFEDYLTDILEAMEKAQNFIAGLSYEQFMEDDKTAYAVVRALEIVGEAAKNIPEKSERRIQLFPGRIWLG